MPKVKTSVKGQIVIPKEIRDALGIKPGSILNIRVEDKKIIIEPAPSPPEVFVELGEESEKILRESRKVDEERIKRLLRDLGVESGG
ncbi:AbrB/MazE/SpoVT family DNA-binding domain-containing protein [Archaeoglobus neptunius]|uniref:AbrB/MazE/SpoVT family DNA-binding domain-containing protein n=1 Tax=Archaeoglobus neptunius TaxID=2798580 RepID=UPI001928DD1B|nr:AbrB/MazE/SpoVT family DNA-binding domain-containing protein [Archaeoglobus neptunius]